MLFYLFQFVFHFNDEFLDVVVVGFRAHGVDLPTDFLSDKTDFPARSIFMFDRFQKVFTVIGQPDFLFCDIQFFQVVDNFLFQPVFIDILNIRPLIDFFL